MGYKRIIYEGNGEPCDECCANQGSKLCDSLPFCVKRDDEQGIVLLSYYFIKE